MRKATVALVFLMFGILSAMAQDAMCPVQNSSTSIQYVGSTVTLKILLVEFSDVPHRTSPSAYTKTDFENLLVSSGVYVSSNMYNPDGEEVYGSLADYYWIMSDHNLIVSGFVVNTVGAGNIPNWILLGHTKAEYASGAYGIFSDAIDLARAQGLDVDGLGEFVKLVIIYAGNIHYGDALNPQAVGTMYIMSERNGPVNQENGNDPFGRIGVHCHEFAHTLGIGHSSGSRSDLMQDGRRNGPVSTGSNGSAPAPLNPQHRAQKGWISPIVISGQEQWDAHYSLTTPEVFRINSNTSGDYFLIENRRFDQYMVIGSTSVRDYNYWMPICWSQNPTWQFYSQGIMVWRIISGDRGWYETNGLVYASGRYGAAYPDNTPTETDAGDLFPGTANITTLSPWSDPRNPYEYTRDEGPPHHSLCVPNTKAGTNAAMQVLSENSAGGYFTLKLYSSNPPNPALNNQTTVASAISGNNQRKLYRQSSGTLHEAFENGGEIFYRKSTDGGGSWIFTSQLTSGNGGNSFPCITVGGSSILVAWQRDYRDYLVRYHSVCVRRSTDAGSSWLGVSTLESGIAYRSPGPIPSISGYDDGSVFAAYRGQSAMVCWKSTNSGASWTSIPNVPGTTGNSNMPSSAINTTYWTTKQANLAYATDIPDGTPRIQYNYYDYQTGSWGSPTDLCSILPPNYIHHANPSLAVSSDESYKTVHVAWDADDTYPGNRVLVHRESGFRGFPSVYSVLQYQSESKPSISGVSQDRAWMVYQSASGYGIWKRYYDGTYWSGYYGTWIGVGFNPQISVGSATAKYIWTNGAASPYQINLSSESLNKTGNELAYSRALNVLDPVTQSSIGLELAPGEILRKTKDVEPLALANTLNDSVVFGATELLDAGSTEDFVLPSDADTLIIPMAAYGISAEKLFSNGGGMVRLSIVNSRTGAVLASFGSTAGSAISGNSRALSNLHVPVAPIMAAAKGAVLRVRPEFIGLRDDLRPTFSLGHIYRKPLNTLMFKVNADLQCNASLVAEPTSFELSQTYPNPFNPSTTIGYQLPTEVTVKLAVFDVLGRQVVELASGVQPAGYYSVKWDASSLASGIYYARFIVTDELGKVQFAKVNKMLLMK